jgi:DNA repair protein RecN (Recombination protein N)
MLRGLVVKDLALIEELDLEFGAGFNVVSGETGAGKSLLQRALAAAAGQRLGADSIRAGAEQATVEAVFTLDDAPAARTVLESIGVDAPKERLRVTRTIPRASRARASIDDTAASVASLTRLGEALVHLQGQHESIRLSEPEIQLAILDAAARTDEAALEYRQDWERLAECIRRVEALERDVAERSRRLELARYDLEEIERARLDGPDEVERLGQERARLRNLHRLTGAVEEALERLDAGERPALAAVEAAAQRLGELAEIDAGLQEPVSALQQAAAPLAEAVRSLERYAGNLDADPARLDEIEERLALISRLLRKHAVPDMAGLLGHRESLSRQVRQAEADASDPEALRREIAASADEAWRSATELSRLRHDGAAALAKGVEAELAQLGMPDARFAVDFQDLPESLGGSTAEVLRRDGVTLGPEGLERVEFLLAANPGEGARSLARVASGGELSRIMLALRHVAGGASVPTLVFDEVDAGIGGAAADTVGRRLHALGRRHQVICITHLAQIAAFADQHYAVVKSRKGDRTRTSVRRVEGEEQVAELARMLAGADPGDEGLRHAREMIRRARESVALERPSEGARPRGRAARRGA